LASISFYSISNMFNIDRYSFWIQYSQEDEEYIAFVYEFPGITGSGETPEEALKEVQTALSGAISICERENLQIPKAQIMADWDCRPSFIRKREILNGDSGK